MTRSTEDKGPPGSGGSPPPPGGGPPPGGFDPGPPGGGDAGPPGSRAGLRPPAPGQGPPREPAGLPPDFDRKKLLRFFLPFLRPHVATVVLSTSLVAVTALLGLYNPQLPRWIAESWRDVSTLALILAGALLANLAALGIGIWQTWLTVGVSESVANTLRKRIFRQIERLSMQTIFGQEVGQFAQRIGGDVGQVQSFLAQTASKAVGDFFRVLAFAGALLWLNWKLALFGIAACILIPFPVRFLNRKVERLAHRGQTLGAGMMTGLIEGVGGFKEVVAANRFPTLAADFERGLDDLRRTNTKASMWFHVSGTLPGVLFAVVTVAIYYLWTGEMRAERMIVAPEVRIGEMMSYVALLVQFTQPVVSLTELLSQFAMTLPAFHELNRVLTTDEIRIPASPRPCPAGPLDIKLVNVQLAYEKGRQTLKDVTFAIPAGKLTAIVGQSGSGKTTIFHLLLRLIEPTGGKILVGGVPLDQIDMKELRRKLGFIPQTPFIFNRSIRENIEIGADPETTSGIGLDEVVRAASLEELIAKRSKEGGLDAVAGHLGNRLSGGEKQRIALARLFLRNPEIIVCDEYTANIDNATARLIEEVMAKTFKGKTRVVITHQLYTVKHADQIVVISDGRVEAFGTHEKLLSRPGLYRDMWDVQKLA